MTIAKDVFGYKKGIYVRFIGALSVMGLLMINKEMIGMNKKEIEQILKDYHWMINSIKILRDSMKDAGEGLTAQYGVEASLPKPKGVTGDPIYREYLRREKRWKKIEQYERKVKMIQDRIHVIQDEREFEVLHWLLDGKSYRWIAMHMGLSHSHIRRLKDSIVEQLAKNVPDVPNVPKDTISTKEKSAC